MRNKLLRFSVKNLTFGNIVFGFIIIFILLFIINLILINYNNDPYRNYEFNIAMSRLNNNSFYNSPPDLDIETQKLIEAEFIKSNKTDLFIPNSEYMKYDMINNNGLSITEYEQLVSGSAYDLEMYLPINTDDYTITFDHLEQKFIVTITNNANYENLQKNVLPSFFNNFDIREDQIVYQ
jgi:hypothetical protein